MVKANYLHDHVGFVHAGEGLVVREAWVVNGEIVKRCRCGCSDDFAGKDDAPLEGFFPMIKNMYDQSTCPFCNPDRSSVIIANDHALSFYDGYPVTVGHTLVVPKRHIASFFDATREEQAALFDLLTEMRQLLLEERSPDGFNVGINDGAAAGQTLKHLHIHLIPRYAGDTDDPRGGVRWIMPEKAPYWRKKQ